MRVLVTGSAGQLGTDVVLACAAAGDQVIGLSRADLDISDLGAVRRVVDEVRPDAIINCAAWTAVDGCEADPERADRINHQGVGYLAEASAAKSSFPWSPSGHWPANHFRCTAGVTMSAIGCTSKIMLVR